MKRFISRIAPVVALVMLCSATARAELSTTEGKGQSTSNQTSIDKGESERKSNTITDDKGWRIGKDSSSGMKKSTTRSIQHSLDKVNSKSLVTEISIVPIMIKPYLVDYPWLEGIELDDVLTSSTKGGRMITYMDNLSKMASAQSKNADRFFNKEKLTSYMNDLQTLGYTLAKSIGTPPKGMAGVLGSQDWEDIAQLVHDNTQLKPVTKYNTSGVCRFVGNTSTIACGQCTLHISQAQGVPELYCSGQPVFTNSVLGGLTMKASVNESFSVKDAESEAQNDETFKSLTNTMNNYVAHSAAKGQALEATLAKKAVYSTAVTNSRKADSAIKQAVQKGNPHGILSMVGMGGLAQ